MNYLCAIIGAALLGVVAMVATVIVILCRPPRCPACKSAKVDEHPCHCVCRTCGERWNEPRFGTYGGGDL